MYHMDKEEYKRRILASQLFSLNREEEATGYKRETLKMIEYIFGYLLCVNEGLYCEYGLEITLTVERCIKFYDQTKGDFLHYFLSAWEVEFARVKAKEIDKNRLGGMHITEDDRIKIRKIIRFAQTSGKDYLSEDFANNVSKATGIAKEIVEDLIGVVEAQVVPESATNEKGEDFSLFDLVNTNEKSHAEKIVETEEAIAFIKKLELFYQSRQERQKPILSALITAKLIEELFQSQRLIAAAKHCTYFDYEIEAEFLEKGSVPTARAIAEKFGVSEQSLSRTWKNFIEKYRG